MICPVTGQRRVIRIGIGGAIWIKRTFGRPVRKKSLAIVGPCLYSKIKK